MLRNNITSQNSVHQSVQAHDQAQGSFFQSFSEEEEEGEESPLAIVSRGSVCEDLVVPRLGTLGNCVRETKMECLVLRLRRLWFGLIMAVGCWNSVWAQTDPNDVAAMQILQKQWGTELGWTGLDPCANNWIGVGCSNNRVITLTLISFGLTGTVPSAIGELSALIYLDLSFNKRLKGVIPTELGSLTGLSTLNMQWCSLSGSIPGTIGNLRNLTFIALNNNRLSGILPPELGALSKLYWFDVAYNSLQGPLPVSTTSSNGLGIDSWPNIQHYHLNDNAFTGQIPREIGFASKVVHVLMENNQFTGPIPDSLGNMSSLQILNLYGNQLSGPIPVSLNSIIQNGSNATGLHQIRVGNNKLTGTIPVFDALSHLEYVDFSNNSFNPQPFPSWLNESKYSLETILMDSCNLIGPLPTDLLSFPALQGLYLRNNQINGSLNIPLNLGSDLRYVYLQNNKIVNINNAADQNAKLPEIQLAGNPTCTGGGITTASPTVCNATSTPPVQKWTSPLVINSCSNNCGSTGQTLNPFTCHCSYPLIITLEIRAPTFTTIDNQTLWDSLANETNKSLLSLSATANIPYESSQLWVYDAYYGNETERVDVRLFFFPLQGEVMEKKIQNFIMGTFTQQKVVYGSPFKPEIVLDVEVSQAPTAKRSSKISTGVIIGIAVGGALALLVIGLLALLAVKHKRRAEDERKKNPFAAWGRAEDGQAPQLKGAHWFSFDDIKRMTNNFSEDNVLGAGGYGKVYKGIQAGTGAMLAVKRAQEGSKQGAAEFKKEIEILSRVHHNNLVGLVGFCFEKSEQMLVYEYMPNGTLTDWLRGDRSDEPLDWDRRLLIALGAAQGISYLHHHADPQIIHRDVKSCNILLDGDLNSKVADFGLSMLVPDVKDGSLKPTIKGTMGYLDPEYYMTNVLSPKSDVYSFGVVLLELLTARPPVSYRGHIVKTMRTRYDSSGMPGVKELLDPVLLGGSANSSEEQETLLKMALVCVEDSSLERPSMHEVVKQLEVLVGPKAQLMPGRRGKSMEERMESRERRAPLEMDRVFHGNGSRGSRGSRGSSGGQLESFKYSGGFVTEPVEPK